MALAHPRTRYAKSGQLAIAYQVLGEGPQSLIVVPPGLALMDAAWDEPALANFWRRLSTFMRLVVLDKRGTGLSDRVEGVPTLEDRMDDVRAVMDAVGLDRAALLGGSEAGPITALFAATHPERVTALILINAVVKWTATADFPWAYSPEQIQTQLDYVERGWGSGWSGENFFAPSLSGDARAREWVARVERLTGTPSAMATLLAMNALIDVRPILDTIVVPTLVIQRAADHVVDAHNGRYFADHIEGSKYVELPGEDHWWWVGDANSIVEEIEEFITGKRHAPDVDRVLKTLLFTDIVASTERASQLGDHTWRDLLDLHDGMVRSQLDRFQGQEVNTTGDGFVACFDGPARAIRCAQAIISGATELGVQVRAGIHTGECERRGHDLAGIAVHVAARVAAIARPHEVLVTGTVRDLVAGSGIGFDDRGEHSLKGVSGRWVLLAARA
jgi:class 3 adenylate cyclase/pimeloyl-ACP methyl ester carboxylesterase